MGKGLRGRLEDDNGLCGIFFDPPYGSEKREKNLYHSDSLSIASEVAKWSAERGKNNTYRIVLCGYYEEHQWLLQEGWRVLRWQAGGGYANQGKSRTNTNRFQEALFFSPYCIEGQRQLWGEKEGKASALAISSCGAATQEIGELP